MDVLCIGHAAWDLSLPLDHFPAEDSKVEITSLAESGGGPAANAAYLLSKWGVWLQVPSIEMTWPAAQQDEDARLLGRSVQARFGPIDARRDDPGRAQT